MNVVRCAACGGAIGNVPGRSEARCLFCGSDALTPAPADVEPPVGHLPFRVDEAAARAAFRTFARGSFFAPAALRDAPLELRRLLLPAWSWDGTLETTWTGLVRASTRSGKRPVAGRDVARFDDVLVPASATLTQRELGALGAFDGALAPWSEATATEPWEVPVTSRQAARATAIAAMRARHADGLAAKHGLVSVKTASIPSALDGTPVLLPVWVGVYRWKDVPRRVLVHGLDGRVVARRPVDPARIALVVGAVLAVLAFVALLVALS